jgi:hypothetical protein
MGMQPSVCPPLPPTLSSFCRETQFEFLVDVSVDVDAAEAAYDLSNVSQAETFSYDCSSTSTTTVASRRWEMPSLFRDINYLAAARTSSTGTSVLCLTS